MGVALSSIRFCMDLYWVLHGFLVGVVWISSIYIGLCMDF
jgi:hypothetical protein